MLTFLKTRRSTLAAQMIPPGPTAAQITELLTIAARVPDHGKLAPWRFIILDEAAQTYLGARAAQSSNPNAQSAEIEQARFARAPCVIAVIGAPKAHPKIPKQEMILSAGACCMNLLIAAQAMGFAAQWLTEWVAYDADILTALSVGEEEFVAGFIYIGKRQQEPKERARPALSEITQYGLG